MPSPRPEAPAHNSVLGTGLSPLHHPRASLGFLHSALHPGLSLLPPPLHGPFSTLSSALTRKAKWGWLSLSSDTGVGSYSVSYSDSEQADVLPVAWPVGPAPRPPTAVHFLPAQLPPALSQSTQPQWRPCAPGTRPMWVHSTICGDQPAPPPAPGGPSRPPSCTQTHLLSGPRPELLPPVSRLPPTPPHSRALSRVTLSSFLPHSRTSHVLYTWCTFYICLLSFLILLESKVLKGGHLVLHHRCRTRSGIHAVQGLCRHRASE